ncbi:MAG: hypothetical protein ACLQU1_28680 [Bryobacteraceae bacterium]
MPVREPVASGKIEIGDTQVIAEHRLAEGRGATVIDLGALSRLGAA